MRQRGVAIVTLLWLAACGRDPILERADEKSAAAGVPGVSDGPVPGNPAPPPEGVPGTPTPGEPGAPTPGEPGAPTPGIPDEPAPGLPGQPGLGEPAPAPPGAPGAPTPGIPDEPTPGKPDEPPPGGGAAGAAQGPTVAVSGTVVYAGWKAGSIRLTAFDGDHGARAGGNPKVIGFGEIARPGPFTFAVPEKAGKVYVEASLDEDGDGRPGPQDPQGKADRFPVTVGEDAVDGLTVTLEKRPPPPGGSRE